MRPDYSHIFQARRRLITSIKRQTRALLMDSGNGKQYLFPRPITLVNMLQAWNPEDTTNDFLLKGYDEKGVIICSSQPDFEWKSDTIAFEHIPVEDLVRIDNLTRRRIEQGYDKPFKLPKIIRLAPVDPKAEISQTSVHTMSDGGFQHVYSIGALKLVGFFWFKREDVRLCPQHARPFQPLQPATGMDVAARCPWCSGGELHRYWSVYKTTHQRLALMNHLNKLLPDDKEKDGTHERSTESAEPTGSTDNQSATAQTGVSPMSLQAVQV